MTRVLIVDPCEDQRATLCTALTQAGFVVDQAGSRADALVALAADTRAIITEAMLPDGSDVDLIEQVRADPRGAEVAVVVTSTEAHPVQIERARRAGAHGWLLRPFPVPALVAALSRLP